MAAPFDEVGGATAVAHRLERDQIVQFPTNDVTPLTYVSVYVRFSVTTTVYAEFLNDNGWGGADIVPDLSQRKFQRNILFGKLLNDSLLGIVVMITGKSMAVSALVVGTAAAVGFYIQSDRNRHRSGRSRANLGARVVETVPQDATVVDISSERLSEIPGAKRVLEKAVRNKSREGWEHVTFERDGAWAIVDSIRQSLPYYDGDSGAYNGVYVHCNGYVIVLDAIGWARLETPTH